MTDRPTGVNRGNDFIWKNDSVRILPIPKSNLNVCSTKVDVDLRVQTGCDGYRQLKMGSSSIRLSARWGERRHGEMVSPLGHGHKEKGHQQQKAYGWDKASTCLAYPDLPTQKFPNTL